MSAAALLSADSLRLRTGETIRGTYVGGNSRQVSMDINGTVRTYDVGQVDSVIFEPLQPPPPPPQASAPRDRRDYDRDPQLNGGRDRDYGRNNQASNNTMGMTIPSGTEISVRMIDAVNSETSRLGQTFRASIDEPVMVNGQQVIPRGADVLTKLVTDERSGRFEGKTILTLALQTITVNGVPVDVTSSDVQTASNSRGSRTAKVVGGTAAVGAIIGAIAGGGKGAAIGAGSGAAVGAGAEVLTGGQKVKIPSETRLTFRLQAPANL